MGPTLLDREIAVKTIAWWTFRKVASEVPAARKRTISTLRGESWDPQVIDICASVVTELSTNCVQHAEKSLCFMVRLAYRLRRPLISVYDWDSTPPTTEHQRDVPQLLGSSNDPLESPRRIGMGLLLVSDLSKQWGWHPTSVGKCVWSLPRLPEWLDEVM